MNLEALNLWDEGCQDSMNIDGGCMINAGEILLTILSNRQGFISQSKIKSKYGTVEMRKRRCQGDWLWPACGCCLMIGCMEVGQHPERLTFL